MKSIPTKKTITVAGSILEYVASGTSSPTLVLINGAGGPIEGWNRVFSELEKIGTVFAYNRLNVGCSSKPTEPQTGDLMVQTLRALLLEVGLPPPYVLIGHSLGGLIANLFARCHPSEVLAVVFLDATAPEDFAVFAAHEGRAPKLLRKTLDAIFGNDGFGEIVHVSRTSDLVSLAPSFPDIPVAVVTGGKPAMSWLMPASILSARAEHQRRLASISPRAKQIIAERSGHFPQLSEPTVVVHTIRETLANAYHSRKTNGYPQCSSPSESYSPSSP
ncbi:MAG: alpha/beta fold hydrolase [Nitrosomonadales bacterium]|nr:alpha/beta fold hydrolase [Nitrosomonadales bacterium]